jgi:alkyl sulfatase BDS1-like metallo-beta-lactamase superfamily hydrolase
MKKLNIALAAALITVATGCSKTSGVGGTASDATPETLKINAQFAKDLKLDDPQDFEDAKRGFIAKPSGKILAPDGSRAQRL